MFQVWQIQIVLQYILGKVAKKSFKSGQDIRNWARLASLGSINSQSQPEYA